MSQQYDIVADTVFLFFFAHVQYLSWKKLLLAHLSFTFLNQPSFFLSSFSFLLLSVFLFLLSNQALLFFTIRLSKMFHIFALHNKCKQPKDTKEVSSKHWSTVSMSMYGNCHKCSCYYFDAQHYDILIKISVDGTRESASLARWMIVRGKKLKPNSQETNMNKNIKTLCLWNQHTHKNNNTKTYSMDEGVFWMQLPRHSPHGGHYGSSQDTASAKTWEVDKDTD